jgi:hypothetical protein
MATITIPRCSSVFVDEGVLVTYQGTPNICTYWEVVSWVDPTEGTPKGSLVHSILVTDDNGFAVNQYIGSGSDGDAGLIERIKVSEGA